MRIVVTGASGFVGQRIVAALDARGHGVVAASRRPLPPGTPGEWRKSPDLDAHADWSFVLAQADVVVHAAARVHVMADQVTDPLAEFRRVNVEGTAALARQAAKVGVGRFLFVSSIKVNGETTTGRRPFSATEPPAPVDPYGISKWEAEQVLTVIGAAAGMETASVRPVLVHGKGVKGNMATLARIAARGWPVPLGAVRNNRRSLVHVGNLADLIACAATFPRTLPPVMLVRDDESPSTADLLHRLANAAGRTTWLPGVPASLLTAAARLSKRTAWADRLLGSLEVNDGATRAALGWTPSNTLDDGLAETIADLR